MDLVVARGEVEQQEEAADKDGLRACRLVSTPIARTIQATVHLVVPLA